MRIKFISPVPLLLSLSIAGGATAVAQYYGPQFGRKIGIITEDFGARYEVKSPTDKQGRNRFDQARFWWVDLPWDGDEKAFLKAQQSIDKAVKSGVRPVSLLPKLRSQAESDKANALAFYRWMYVAWLAQKQKTTRQEALKTLAPVTDRVFRLDFPRTYRYARQAFLTQAFSGPSRHQETLGLRLLKRNPQDEDVRFYMVRVTSAKAIVPALRPQAQKQSLAYLNYFQKKYPQKGYYDREEGKTWDYFRRLSGHPTYYANNIVSAYNRYLSKNPKAIDRQAIQKNIKELNQTNTFAAWYRAAVQAEIEGRSQPIAPSFFNKKPKATQEWFQKQIKAEARRKSKQPT